MGKLRYSLICGKNTCPWGLELPASRIGPSTLPHTHCQSVAVLAWQTTPLSDEDAGSEKAGRAAATELLQRCMQAGRLAHQLTLDCPVTPCN